MSPAGMACLAAVTVTAVTPLAASGDQVVQSIDCQRLQAAGALAPGVTVAPSSATGGPCLRIVHTAAAPTTVRLTTIERPAITESRYALRGHVRLEGVARGSYLEMWSVLPDGEFFTRTLAEVGPMGRLEGTVSWREFLLPFTNRGGGRPPARLVVNLVLAGPGTVEIGPIELVQFAAGEALATGSSGAWWSARRAGMVGAIAGTVLGLLGAVIGWLASSGRARTLVFATLRCVAGGGLIALIAGTVALTRGQPHEVYYPLLLVGGLGTVFGFALPRSLGRRYEQLELDRIRALDA